MCTFRASCYSTRLTWAHTPVMSWVSEKEEGVVALHLPVEPLKTSSWLEPVPRCEPSTYQPISDDIATATSGPVKQLHLLEVHIL